MESKLVYIGNLGEGYDLETVIRAIAAEQCITLDIAGRGPKEVELKRLVQSLGLGDRVRFHGYLRAEELAELLAGCDIGVIPMRDDSWVGLPYKLGDYLKAGLRVVSSLHGECGALLARHSLGETYDFGSVASLLNAIRKLSATSGKAELPPELRSESIYPEYVKFCYSHTSAG